MNIRLIVATHITTSHENLLKTGSVNFEIFGWICQFLPYRLKSIRISPVISVVTGPNFIDFLHDEELSLSLLNRRSALRYSNPFRNASATNQGS